LTGAGGLIQSKIVAMLGSLCEMDGLGMKIKTKEELGARF
jgi:hypothetical protein